MQLFGRSEPRTQRSGVSGAGPLTPLGCVRGSDVGCLAHSLDPPMRCATIRQGFAADARGADMASLLTCPRGHRFDVTLEDLDEAALRLACPLCGALCPLPAALSV